MAQRIRSTAVIAMVMVLGAALSPAAVATPGLSCLDKSEITALREVFDKNAAPRRFGIRSSGSNSHVNSQIEAMRDERTRGVAASSTDDATGIGILLSRHKKLLDLAEQGEPDAMKMVGQAWADCMLENGPFAAKKQALTTEFLRASASKGDKESMERLGMMYALGWGVPNDSHEARLLLAAAGHPVDLTMFSKVLPANAPQAELESAAVYAIALAKLLSLQLPAHTEDIVRRKARGKTIAMKAAFMTCPAEISISGPEESIDLAASLLAVRSIASLIPTTGLPCSNDFGGRFGFQLPLNVFHPHR